MHRPARHGPADRAALRAARRRLAGQGRRGRLRAGRGRGDGPRADAAGRSARSTSAVELVLETVDELRTDAAYARRLMHELSIAGAIVDTAVTHADGRPVTRREPARRRSCARSCRTRCDFYFGIVAREHGLRGRARWSSRSSRRGCAARAASASGRRARRPSAARRAAAADVAVREPARSSRSSRSRWRRPHASREGPGRRGRARRQQHDRARQPRRLRPPRRDGRQPDERAGRGQDDAARARARRLGPTGVRVGVLEGDVQGSLDADRLAHLHIPVVQLNTDNGFGGECHLDANMVRSALPALPLDDIDLLIIENVGNLVCPAEFRIGEDARIMVSSVAEGEDKPLKYPLMFRACELVVDQQDRPARRTSTSTWTGSCYHLDAVHPGVEHAAGQRAHGRGGRGAARLARAPARARGSAGLTQRPGQRRGPRRARCSTRGCEANERVLRRRGRAPRAAVPRDGRALRARRAAARVRRVGRRTGSDARHVAVEFVHPVIVGKRALPRARRWRPERVALLAEADDIAIAFGAGDGGRGRRRGGARARLPDRRVRAVGAEWEFQPPADDPFVAPGAGRDALPRALGARARVLRAPRAAQRPRRRAGARHRRVELPLSVPRRARARPRRGARGRARVRAGQGGARSSELRAQTLGENRDAARRRGARRCARCFDAGGRLLALGNGGSATDAMDAVADLPPAGPRGWPARRRST